jgi:hypothetical protein
MSRRRFIVNQSVTSFMPHRLDQLRASYHKILIISINVVPSSFTVVCPYVFCSSDHRS